jgi:hypothetical protein
MTRVTGNTRKVSNIMQTAPTVETFLVKGNVFCDSIQQDVTPSMSSQFSAQTHSKAVGIQMGLNAEKTE